MWTFPFDLKPKAATIKTHKKKGFNFFEWEYARPPGAYAIYLYDIKGVQSRKNPRLWGGELSIRALVPEAISTADPYCRLADVGGTAADEGVLTWRAKLVKACSGQCESPFQRADALVVGQ